MANDAAHRTLTLQILRYNPQDPGRSPRMQPYQLEEADGMTLFIALNEIRERQDPSLQFDFVCRAGICGSCGMMINGREWLACEKRLSDFASVGPVRVAPLQAFPVIRDLVIDMADFVEKLEKTRPWLIRDNDEFPGEAFRQAGPT